MPQEKLVGQVLWLHPNESSTEVDQAPGGMIILGSCLGEETSELL